VEDTAPLVCRNIMPYSASLGRKPDRKARAVRTSDCHDGHLRSAQVFNPYGRPYALPVPMTVQPSAVTVAPDLNFPEVSDGGLLALADAESNFALRFSGG